MTRVRWEHTKFMFEKQKVDRLLDGLKSNHFIGLKSNILCNQMLRNDFNVSTSHLKDMVNWKPQIKNPPGRQVSAMDIGGGHGCGTDHGGNDGHAGCDGHGGRGYDSGRGHGGRGNERGRRGDRTSSTHTFRPKRCPDQEAVDRSKLGIVSRYVIGDRIFVCDKEYNSEMTAAARHAVFQIRANLKVNKDPLGRASRKHNTEVEAL